MFPTEIHGLPEWCAQTLRGAWPGAWLRPPARARVWEKCTEGKAEAPSGPALGRRGVTRAAPPLPSSSASPLEEAARRWRGAPSSQCALPRGQRSPCGRSSCCGPASCSQVRGGRGWRDAGTRSRALGLQGQNLRNLHFLSFPPPHPQQSLEAVTQPNHLILPGFTPPYLPSVLRGSLHLLFLEPRVRSSPRPVGSRPLVAEWL